MLCITGDGKSLTEFQDESDIDSNMSMEFTQKSFELPSGTVTKSSEELSPHSKPSSREFYSVKTSTKLTEQSPFSYNESMQQKSTVEELQEYCQENELVIQDYKEILHTKGFYYTINISGKSYYGPVKHTALQAKESAAKTAMKILSKPIH